MRHGTEHTRVNVTQHNDNDCVPAKQQDEHTNGADRLKCIETERRWGITYQRTTGGAICRNLAHLNQFGYRSSGDRGLRKLLSKGKDNVSERDG